MIYSQLAMIRSGLSAQVAEQIWKMTQVPYSGFFKIEGLMDFLNALGGERDCTLKVGIFTFRYESLSKTITSQRQNRPTEMLNVS